jgi:uncharacterized protein YuzB (UPF0349 family)
MFLRRVPWCFMEVFFLVDYMISCFDLFFDLIKQDNLLIVLPFCCLVFCFCFALVIRLIKGEYRA